MERQFESSLRDLKEQLVRMAGNVEKAIDDATQALAMEDPTRIQKVYELEKKINQAHMAIDEACIKLLATQQPMAKDLRLIVAILKINTDLERMGDQAVNIAHNSERYLKAEPLKPLVDLPVMFAETKFMVREALDSFVQNDVLMAQDVLKRDDKVDALKHKIFTDVLEAMKARPALIEQGLCLILIARNLERIGDHATNIAEDLIFAITGDDIRHGPRIETVKEGLKK